MADTKTRQLKPSVLQEDLDAYAGMQGIAGYAPSNAVLARRGVIALRENAGESN